VQILINGLISGSAIALLALAFQIVYLPTRVFFIALGGLYSAAPYFALAVGEAGGMPLAVAVSITGGVGLSVLCEWASHARLARRIRWGAVDRLAGDLHRHRPTDCDGLGQ
jgi:branched-chain amino acid transport system permease protein